MLSCRKHQQEVKDAYLSSYQIGEATSFQTMKWVSLPWSGLLKCSASLASQQL